MSELTTDSGTPDEMTVARWAVKEELKGMLEGAAGLAESEGRVWGQFELKQMAGPTQISMAALAQAIRELIGSIQ